MSRSWSTPFQILWQSVRLSAANARPLARRLALPSLLGTVTLFLFFSVYCQELLFYMAHPSGAVGSRVLGVAAGGALLVLFFHSLSVAAICEVLLRRTDDGPSFIGIRPWSWRLYVANLRLMLVLISAGFLFWAVNSALQSVGIPADCITVANIVLSFGLFWLFIRIWFLLLPVCLSQGEGSMLTEAWRHSAGHFWIMAATQVPLLLLVMLLELLGQHLLIASRLVSPVPAEAPLTDYVALYRDNLLPIVLLIALTYLVGVVLTTVARQLVYQQITDTPFPPT